jgi:predicted dehydrogenase
MNKLRIGMIGAGGIAAKLHFPELAEESRRAQVTLIAGRRESRLRFFRDRYGVPRFTHRYEDVINDAHIDGVIVATPHPQHVEWGIKALRAGKHLYMQKPLCGDMAEADAFVAEVQRHPGRTVLCLPHFGDLVQTVRKNVRDGVIGKVSGGRARTAHGGPEVYYRDVARIFGEPPPEGELWFFDARRAGVGALFDMGVYAVANTVALLGSVKSVQAVTATIDKPTELEDTASLVMRMASGAVATAETSWCDPARTWEFSVHGTTGKYRIADGEPPTHHVPTALDSDDSPVSVSEVRPTVKVGNSHAHWLDCIEKGIQPPVSHAYAARHVTEVLLAGLESGRTGRTVQIRSGAEA